MLSKVKSFLQNLVYGVFDPLVRAVRELGITPNNITTLGFLINIIATIFLVYPMFSGQTPETERLFTFGWIVFAAGLMDMLDGRMARIFKLHSTYGAFYDSVMDRYSELIMFLGLMAYFIAYDDWLLIMISFWAMCGSLMVSYARARAEGLNVDCSVGLMQRPERLSIVVWSCWIAGALPDQSHIVMAIGIGIVAVLANWTAFQRMWHVKKQTLNQAVNQ